MAVNKNLFFQEAALRICGSLDIEKALWLCFMYIKEFIPADQVFLTYYDADLGTIKALASANSDGGRRLNTQILLSPKVRAMIEKDDIPEIILANRPELSNTFKPVADALQKGASFLGTRLRVERHLVGAFYVCRDGQNIYSKNHIRLIALLKEPFAIALANSLRHQEVLELKERLADDKNYLQKELQRIAGEEVVGAEFGLKDVMGLVRQVSPLDSPVLLLGETGTGKEVIANTIHNSSRRSGGPFIKVNCGAIPDTLMDSELFGHEKGAFTGALYLKRGRFERAHKGTIFLDEIGELSPEAQVRLLRVLQEKEIERVGGSQTIKVDIRVIAATHHNLEELLLKGRLREDLYFRLKVFPIFIPPLRNRMGDIPALVHHFMKKKSNEMGFSAIPTLAPSALDQLMSYNWPGNVREIENAVERALILNKDKPLTFSDIQFFTTRDMARYPLNYDEKTLKLDKVISQHIDKVLELTGGRVQGEKGAARLLGLKPNTLRYRMTKLGIPFGRKTEMK